MTGESHTTVARTSPRRPTGADDGPPGGMGQDGGVPTWKPHNLAKPRPDQLDLRMHDRVLARIDLPGAPEGTKGKILLADGFNWLRYRVLFTNGVELGDLDERHIKPTGKAARRLVKQAKRAARAT